jgi:hypothetical protein
MHLKCSMCYYYYYYYLLFGGTGSCYEFRLSQILNPPASASQVLGFAHSTTPGLKQCLIIKCLSVHCLNYHISSLRRCKVLYLLYASSTHHDDRHISLVFFE